MWTFHLCYNSDAAAATTSNKIAADAAFPRLPHLVKLTTYMHDKSHLFITDWLNYKKLKGNFS